MTESSGSLAMLVLRTDQIEAGVLADVHALLLSSFCDTFDDDDRAHCVGGWHVLLRDESHAVVAHAAVVPRAVTLDEVTYAAGYVEAVATRPDLHGQGIESAPLMILPSGRSRDVGLAGLIICDERPGDDW